MQTFNYPLTVFSADGSHCETVEALAGTRTTHTSLPSSLLQRLGIEWRRTVKVELPDGSFTEWYAGEARLSIDGVKATCIVLFADDHLQPRLGKTSLSSVIMEVDPEQPRLRRRQRLLLGGGPRLVSPPAPPPANQQ